MKNFLITSRLDYFITLIVQILNTILVNIYRNRKHTKKFKQKARILKRRMGTQLK